MASPLLAPLRRASGDARPVGDGSPAAGLEGTAGPPEAGSPARRVAVVTSSRADYGYIKPIVRELRGRTSLETLLIATGSHLMPQFGFTVKEIEADGFMVDFRVPIETPVLEPHQMAHATGEYIVRFSRLFAEIKPDLLVVIADRYEMFGVAAAGALGGLVVAHISGGDITEGAIDDSLRHAMTKLSHLHFPSNDLSAKRLEQMGEEGWRIHVVGEPSLDEMAGLQWVAREDLMKRVGMEPQDWEPPLVATLHPETLRPRGVEVQSSNFIAALAQYSGPLVITAANHDAGGELINKALRGFASGRPKTYFVESLGWVNYVSLMRQAAAMIGNSSSGILEAPSFKLPVVNIGRRQGGRLRAANVIDVEDNPDSIQAGLRKALSRSFRESLRDLVNPYYDGNSARKIADVLERVELKSDIRQKRFVRWPN